MNGNVILNTVPSIMNCLLLHSKTQQFIMLGTVNYLKLSMVGNPGWKNWSPAGQHLHDETIPWSCGLHPSGEKVHWYEQSSWKVVSISWSTWWYKPWCSRCGGNAGPEGVFTFLFLQKKSNCLSVHHNVCFQPIIFIYTRSNNPVISSLTRT